MLKKGAFNNQERHQTAYQVFQGIENCRQEILQKFIFLFFFQLLYIKKMFIFLQETVVFH